MHLESSYETSFSIIKNVLCLGEYNPEKRSLVWNIAWKISLALEYRPEIGLASSRGK